jgi:hypothetical protein
VHVDVGGGLGHCVLDRVVGGLLQLLAQLLVLHVLGDVQGPLVGRSLDRALPTRLDRLVLEQTQALQRRRELTQVTVAERGEAHRHDRGRQPQVRGESPHHVLVVQLLRHDPLADLLLGEAVEALAPLQRQLAHAHRTVALVALLLPPAEHLEEQLRLRLVARLARDALDRLLETRLDQALQQRHVLLAEAQPLPGRGLPAAQRRLARSGVGEARPPVELGDLRDLEQLRHAQHALGVDHLARAPLVVQEHGLTHGAEVVVVEGDGAVLVLDGLAVATLDQHQGRAGDLQVAPLGLQQRVAGEVRHQLRVELVDLQQLAVEVDRRRHEQARTNRLAAVAAPSAAVAGEPAPVDVEPRTVVPQVRRRVEDQVEQPLRGTELRLRQGVRRLRHPHVPFLAPDYRQPSLRARRRTGGRPPAVT